MEYRVITIKWQGFVAEVYLCSKCALPEGAEETGNGLFSSNPDMYQCHVCESDMDAVIEAHERR